jgi:hypothetical protein
MAARDRKEPKIRTFGYGQGTALRMRAEATADVAPLCSLRPADLPCDLLGAPVAPIWTVRHHAKTRDQGWGLSVRFDPH